MLVKVEFSHGMVFVTLNLSLPEILGILFIHLFMQRLTRAIPQRLDDRYNVMNEF